MYGTHDDYNSPHSSAPSSQLSAVFGAIDSEVDEFGILGIAIGKKARTKKHEKRLAKVQGKLKSLLDQGKLDKAQKHAKKLQRSVRILEKVDDSYEPSSETEAWIQFSEDGDQGELLEALGQVSMTGDEIDDDDITTTTSTTTTGRPGRSGRGATRRRRLPPGFRPAGYTRWRRGRKMGWLSRHPNAARAQHFSDPRDFTRPGSGRWAPRRGGRAMNPRHPSMRRPGSRRGRIGRRDSETVRPRIQRFGGLIGIEAFNNISDPTGHTRENVLLEAIGNEAAEDVAVFGMDLEETDEFRRPSRRVSRFGAFKQRRQGLTGEGKSFVRSSPFSSRKLDARLKHAKRKYQKAVSVGDTVQANQWLSEYNAIAERMAEMRAKPQVQTVTQARILEEVPLFSTSTSGKENSMIVDLDDLDDLEDDDINEMISFATPSFADDI